MTQSSPSNEEIVSLLGKGEKLQFQDIPPAPCQRACPVFIDIPSYLALLAQGRYQAAWEVIRQDNPFPWVCGLICQHPCEQACVRGHLDEPVNIRYLKAFVAEWVSKHGSLQAPPVPPGNGHKVAIIGSGPAGLSCAYYLALQGYTITVFESLPQPGGLMVSGISPFRLPREIVRHEIEMILSMGVEIRTGLAVGRDITLDELRAGGYEAFFLGIGAHLGYKLNIEGENDFPQVYDTITFLRGVFLGKQLKPADRVVIIGGGNSAMDAARTCIRLGCQEVHVAYRRTRAEMPVRHEEVDQALEEGVQIHFLAIPLKIGGAQGKVAYLECLRAQLGSSDSSGRRRAVPIPGSNFKIAVGAVITAIGQQPDFCFFPQPPVATSRWCTVVIQGDSCRSSMPDIFSGGDAVTGPATVVQAIAAGKQAAAEIHHLLSGGSGPPPKIQPVKRHLEPFQVIPAAAKIASQRHPVPLVDPARRCQTFGPVELPFSLDAARAEAARCLRCDVCTRCGACAVVCSETMQIGALEFKDIGGHESILGDYHRVTQKCIACGACVSVCPTSGLEYIEGPDFREIRLCGSVLNRLETSHCQQCGQSFAPARYLDYVTQHSDQPMAKAVRRQLCPACARQFRAKQFVKL
jgi:NADH-quinone oxidoreductase subunit F